MKEVGEKKENEGLRKLSGDEERKKERKKGNEGVIKLWRDEEWNKEKEK